jgi:hypothetical protein
MSIRQGADASMVCFAAMLEIAPHISNIFLLSIIHHSAAA